MTLQHFSNDELEKVIADRPFDKVTADYMRGRIIKTGFFRIGETLTHCALYIDNGFIVTGESACVDPRNYDQKIGEQIAYNNAFAKLWPLFGFLLAEKKFWSAKEENV